MDMRLYLPLACGLMLVLSGCSTPTPEQLAEHDPWEATNRDIFAADVWIEHNIAQPVTEGYRAVLPEVAREGVHNAVTNLRSPIVLANDILQVQPGKAAQTLGRVVVNSTAGIGGLIDVASEIGIPYHDNDFGITMGKAGAQEGSYLVLPVLGPRPPRDLVGGVVDGAFDPLTWSRFDGRGTLLTVRLGANILDTANRTMDQFLSIERSSIDFYASTRSLYRQSRDAQIGGQDASLALPDF